jgi:hypothetical protein
MTGACSAKSAWPGVAASCLSCAPKNWPPHPLPPRTLTLTAERRPVVTADRPALEPPAKPRIRA